MIRFSRVLALVLAAVLLVPAIPAGAASTKRIESISFSDANNGLMAGGSNGFVSATSDGGATWSAVRMAGAMTGALSVSPTDGYALGFLGKAPFETSNADAPAGATWELESPAISEGGFESVARLSSGRTVMAGTSSAASTALYGGDVGLLASSADGGASWTKDFAGPLYPPVIVNDVVVEPAKETWAGFTDVDAAPSTNVAWAVGTEFEQVPAGADTYKKVFQAILLYKTSNGTDWVAQTISAPADPWDGEASNRTGVGMTSVAAVSSTTAYAAGSTSWVIKTTNGSTWARTPAIPIVQTNKTIDIQAIDAQSQTVVVAGNLSGVAPTPYVAWSKDGGASWSSKSFALANNPRLRDVAILSPTTWLAVGDEEVVLRTTDGGTNWTTVSGAPAVPNLGVTTPTQGAPVSAGPQSVQGTASDMGVGVASVKVRVKRPDNKYWNGSTWVTTETWNSASTSNRWKNWAFSWSAQAAEVASGVEITARATDGLGQYKDQVITSGDARKTSAITLTTGNQTVAYGAAGKVAGHLKSGTSPIAGGWVWLETSANGKDFWYTGQKKQVDPAGYFAFDAKDASKRWYRVRFSATLTHDPATSGVISVDPKVSLSTPAVTTATLYKGKTYTWSSTIKPKHTAGTKPVKFEFWRKEKQSNGTYKWIYKRYAWATAADYYGYTKCSVKYAIPYSGSWAIRAVHDDAAHAYTTSSWLFRTVK